MGNPLSALLIAPIRGYQKFISPALPPQCRYYPTCSSYAVEAIQVHGPLKGVLLGSWRVLRCNPFSRGGVDHVPAKGKWKASEWVPPSDWAGHDIEENVTLGGRGGGRGNNEPIPSNPVLGRKVEGVSPEVAPGGEDQSGAYTSPRHKES